jgi:predicted DNA-binding protein
MTSITIPIRVPVEVAEAIDAICRRTEHSRSRVGRKLLEEGLKGEVFGSAVQPKRAVQRVAKPNATLEIPAFIPIDAWLEWDAYRQAKSGKAWTAHAKKLSISRLINLNLENGADPAAMIRQSIENGWSGLFAPKDVAVGNREDLARRVQPIVESSAEEMF